MGVSLDSDLFDLLSLISNFPGIFMCIFMGPSCFLSLSENTKYLIYYREMKCILYFQVPFLLESTCSVYRQMSYFQTTQPNGESVIEKYYYILIKLTHMHAHACAHTHRYICMHTLLVIFLAVDTLSNLPLLTEQVDNSHAL